MSRYDLEEQDFERILSGQPGYRIAQLKRALFEELTEIDDLSVFPKDLRHRLRDSVDLKYALSPVSEQVADQGLTTKWLYALHDGVAVETVLMHYRKHSTVCVSSQAGCAMACSFCATGKAGYSRQLSTGEIVEQVVRASRAARAQRRRLDHVVFMGMGEPFANFKHVWRAIERFTEDMGLGARHITVSTVGIVPQIRLLAEKPLQINLAVSLHAANNQLRSSLVPVNRRYPIEMLVASLEDYMEKTHRRISFEWALIENVNDSARDVAELAAIAFPLKAHVNLIPLNPIGANSSDAMNGSSPETVEYFADGLRNLGVNVTVRRTRGRSIAAACGQLAGTTAVDLSNRRLPGHLAKVDGSAGG